jgi:hypothetical protein
MAIRFFALCCSGFPLFVIFFSSHFGLVCDSFSFFSSLVWFWFTGSRRKAMCAEKKG